MGLGATAPLLAQDSYPLLVPGLVVAGLGVGLCSPAVVEALRDVPAAAQGQASGMVQTVRQLGGSLGVAAVGAVYTARGLDGAFASAAIVLALVSLGVLVALPERREPVGDVHPVPG